MCGVRGGGGAKEEEEEEEDEEEEEEEEERMGVDTEDAESVLPCGWCECGC